MEILMLYVRFKTENLHKEPSVLVLMEPLKEFISIKLKLDLKIALILMNLNHKFLFLLKLPDIKKISI